MLLLTKQTSIAVLLCAASASFLCSTTDGFVAGPGCKRTKSQTSLNGMFDIFRGGGTADEDDLDEQVRKLYQFSTYKLIEVNFTTSVNSKLKDLFL